MLCLDGNPHDTYTIIQVLNVLGLQCMPHSGMVWAHRNCTVSWNQYLKARENKHAVSGLQNLSGLRLLSKKKKKKKWIVNILFLLQSTTVWQCCLDRFSSLFSFFLWGHKSPTSVATICYPHRSPLSDQRNMQCIFFQYFMTHWTLSVNCIQCAQYVFSVSMSTCCDSFCARLLKDTTCMNYGWTVRG